ncbi:MAG: hypothetical protein COA62_15805 [Rhodobiaceae bacterium]|nr:MAG: hypothetical protein COA62_15805 [Rhodobiaceae bacterium]
MTSICFTVPGPIQPWQRARSNGKFKFTARETVMYQNHVKHCAADAMGNMPLFDGPIVATYVFIFPVPDSWPKWKKEAARRGRLVHDKKPDTDNLVKTIKDACEGIVFTNDCRVYSDSASKWFNNGSGVHTVVTFRLEEDKIGTGAKKSDYDALFD